MMSLSSPGEGRGWSQGELEKWRNMLAIDNHPPPSSTHKNTKQIKPQKLRQTSHHCSFTHELIHGVGDGVKHWGEGGRMKQGRGIFSSREANQNVTSL